MRQKLVRARPRRWASSVPQLLREAAALSHSFGGRLKISFLSPALAMNERARITISSSSARCTPKDFALDLWPLAGCWHRAFVFINFVCVLCGVGGATVIGAPWK
jgi:hypothetical protein